MTGYVLTADIGSTFTKLTATDCSKRVIIGSAKAFTTIETNVMEGFNKALAELGAQTGKIEYGARFAASSAAGGLKMVSCGLVPDLTAKAGRLAAASAGAKVVKTFSYELSVSEQDEINSIKPDIILLSGGIDGGNKEVIIKNAKALAEIEGGFSVIVAGNKAAASEISEIIGRAHKDAVICENVMPEFGKLNIISAKRAIRDLFIKNIISAKGLDEAQALMSAEIIPTPLAVFNAAELLSKGAGKEEGLGALMVYDLGGATTDVYSMAEGSPKRPNTAAHGLMEPYAKRTVEGDIGMRYSAAALAAEAGIERIAQEAGVSVENAGKWIKTCTERPETVPKHGGWESAADEAMAALAVEISSARHCGSLEKTFTVMGEMFLQTGKDLTEVKHIIGTGGQIINSQKPKKILERAAYSLGEPFCLRPVEPSYMLDSSYCFSAMGLLSQAVPETALEIMKNEFVDITGK